MGAGLEICVNIFVLILKTKRSHWVLLKSRKSELTLVSTLTLLLFAPEKVLYEHRNGKKNKKHLCWKYVQWFVVMEDFFFFLKNNAVSSNTTVCRKNTSNN